MKIKKLLAVVAIGASLIIAAPTISAPEAEAQEVSQGWRFGSCRWDAFVSGGNSSAGQIARGSAGTNDGDCRGVAARLTINDGGRLINTQWIIDRTFSNGRLGASHNLIGQGRPDAVRTCGTVLSRNGWGCGTTNF